MDAIKEHNDRYQFFQDITGEAMRVHRKYGYGLMESAYEAALEYLLKQRGMQVDRQVFLPIYWEDVQLDQTYRMDMVVDGVIVELKAVNHTTDEHVRQLWNYMHLTNSRYGMLINFGSQHLYSAWYERNPFTGRIEKVRLL